MYVPIEDDNTPKIDIKINPFKNPRNGMKDFEQHYKESLGKSLFNIIHRDNNKG